MRRFLHIPIIIQVLIAMTLGVAQGWLMPSWFIRIFVTFNDFFGQFITFLMPLIILAMVAGSIVNSTLNAGKMLSITITLVVLSTLLSGMFSLGIGKLILPYCIVDNGDTTILQALEGNDWSPYFTIKIPPALDVMSALALALMIGLGVRAAKASALRKGISELQDVVMLSIENALLPLLPIYIFGVFLKMSATGGMLSMITNFLWVILLTLGVLLMWVLILYLIAGISTKDNPFKMLWKMSPAAIMAFATSSSAATIPMTLKSAKRLVKNEQTVNFTIPLCANLHVPSVAIYFVISALTIMMMVGQPIELESFIPFIVVLSFTCVAAPAIPGGVVAIMPVLASMLNFTPEMQAVCLSLGILLDAPLTAVNVVCDGAICVIVDRQPSTES